MQPTHTQQSALNAANLAAHAQASAAAQESASGHATPRAARGNIPAASAGAEPTDPFASMEQASDPGDNLTFISDATEFQQRERQRENGDLVRLQQELKQEKERADRLAAERDQEHKLRQEAEHGKAAEVATRLEAQRVADARALQLQQERDAASAALALRPTSAQLQAMTAERDARPTLDSLTKVTRDLAAKATELSVQRVRMEAAELKAKQVIAALTPELQAIADKPAALQEAIVWRDISLEMLSIYHVTWLRTDVSLIKKVGWDNVPAYRNLRIQGKAARQSLGII